MPIIEKTFSLLGLMFLYQSLFFKKFFINWGMSKKIIS